MQEKEIHIRDYIRVILKRKAIVFTFFLITFLVVVIGTFTATPQYFAFTKVLIEKNEGNPLYGGRYYSTEDLQFVETQSQIIKSKNVARKVVKNLALGKNYLSYFPDKQKNPGFLQTMTGKIKNFVKDFINNDSEKFAATNAIPAPPGDEYQVLDNLRRNGLVESANYLHSLI